MKYTMMIILMITTTKGFTRDVLPLSCRPLPIERTQLVMSTKTAQLVMIHNLSQQDLWLTHAGVESSAKAGWASKISPNHWSALYVYHHFTMACTESKPGHEQQVDCKDVLAVCEWSKQAPMKLIKSTFWVGEDKPLSELIAYMGRTGYVLK